MPPELVEYAKGLAANFRLADLVDVVVVSVLAYTVISWLKTARSRFVLLGFAALLGVYLLARTLSMHLTLFLFQVGLTVALVALVVIFQEEIRRAFERIATSRLLGARRARTAAYDVVDTLVAATATLARQRTGALVVLRGREPLERHLSGGIPLDGRVSEPLMCSIFDASSPGHDGALLIENGMASRFAVHLPLSTAVKSNARFGTRHTAALGLAERSDALVIVVSEERGTVSVAQDGELVQLKSAVELKQRITEFLSQVMPEKQPPWLQRVFARNLGSKALSVAVASIAWFIVTGYEAETSTRTFTVPVVYAAVPDGWWLEAPSPLEAHVSLSGTASAFRELDPRQLTISLNVSSIHAGSQRLAIDADRIARPKRLVVQSIEPRFVMVSATKTTSVSLPIKPQLSGQIPAGLRLSAAITRPASVVLVVPSSDRSRFTVVRTEPVVLDEVRENLTLTRRLVLPGDARLGAGQPEEAEVQLSVAPR
jgi:diadenylate cyclase